MKYAVAALLIASVSAQCQEGMTFKMFNDEKCSDHVDGKDHTYTKDDVAKTGKCTSMGQKSTITECKDDEVHEGWYKGTDCTGTAFYDFHFKWGTCTKYWDSKKQDGVSYYAIYTKPSEVEAAVEAPVSQEDSILM